MTHLGQSRILVVDGSRVMADGLRAVLEGAGYVVAHASSCQECLVEARRGGFDVALVDLRLPDGDGTMLAPRLAEIVPGSEVILLTDFATLESATAAVRAGAWDYLIKPCETESLLIAVEQALRQVRLSAEKRDLARRAHVAEKLAAVGQLTAGLSHEIRNPLNAAALQLTVLERRIRRLGGDAQGPLLEPLGLVQEEVRRLDHILEDFLQFARPRELTRRPCRLGEMVQGVVEFQRAEAERRQIRLESEIEADPEVAIDDGRLRQALLNLTINALQATPAGGRVTVSLRERAGDLVLAVADTGPGIPEDVRSRMFEPFFTTKAAGSGLGLSIVHAIVTQHGGTVVVESTEGQGASFVLTIPAS